MDRGVLYRATTNNGTLLVGDDEVESLLAIVSTKVTAEADSHRCREAVEYLTSRLRKIDPVIKIKVMTLCSQALLKGSKPGSRWSVRSFNRLLRKHTMEAARTLAGSSSDDAIGRRLRASANDFLQALFAEENSVSHEDSLAADAVASVPTVASVDEYGAAASRSYQTSSYPSSYPRPPAINQDQEEASTITGRKYEGFGNYMPERTSKGSMPSLGSSGSEALPALFSQFVAASHAASKAWLRPKAATRNLAHAPNPNVTLAPSSLSPLSPQSRPPAAFSRSGCFAQSGTGLDTVSALSLPRHRGPITPKSPPQSPTHRPRSGNLDDGLRERSHERSRETLESGSYEARLVLRTVEASGAKFIPTKEELTNFARAVDDLNRSSVAKALLQILCSSDSREEEDSDKPEELRWRRILRAAVFLSSLLSSTVRLLESTKTRAQTNTNTLNADHANWMECRASDADEDSEGLQIYLCKMLASVTDGGRAQKRSRRLVRNLAKLRSRNTHAGTVVMTLVDLLDQIIVKSSEGTAPSTTFRSRLDSINRTESKGLSERTVDKGSLLIDTAAGASSTHPHSHLHQHTHSLKAEAARSRMPEPAASGSRRPAQTSAKADLLQDLTSDSSDGLQIDKRSTASRGSAAAATAAHVLRSGNRPQAQPNRSPPSTESLICFSDSDPADEKLASEKYPDLVVGVEASSVLSRRAKDRRPKRTDQDGSQRGNPNRKASKAKPLKSNLIDFSDLEKSDGEDDSSRDREDKKVMPDKVSKAPDRESAERQHRARRKALRRKFSDQPQSESDI